MRCVPSCGVGRTRVTRTQATGLWTLAVVAWAAARAVMVARVFGPHGTNGWTYFIVDIASSVPYGVTSARAVYAFVDRAPSLPRWCAAATITFFIPDLYIVATARHIPGAIWVGFVTWLAIMTATAIRTTMRSGLR